MASGLLLLAVLVVVVAVVVAMGFRARGFERRDLVDPCQRRHESPKLPKPYSS